MLNKNIILGTAGHIDHGKSSLVKALTGTDPDRLKEEKERGITIDIGFASLHFQKENLTVAIIDVPGHERLIKNMLAGAGGIDIVMMVIAADEGVMPQTREHLAICELLKIKSGIIVITKADLVDKEWIELIKEDIQSFAKGTFLEKAEVITVSAKTGYNLDTLKEKIKNLALDVQPKLIDGLFRMPIDRVFTLKGFGTVVTGTVISGSITVDSPVEILPAGISTKVRGLQSHGMSVEKVYAGQRSGINLQGVDKDDLKRGDVVVVPNRFTPTKVVNATVELLPNSPIIKNRSLVHLYLGTSETVARVILYDKEQLDKSETAYCQLRLKDPIITLSGDRFIIRRFSPLETIGGGQILDPHPGKYLRNTSLADFNTFYTSNLKKKIETKVKISKYKGIKISEIEGWICENITEIRKTINELVSEKTLIKNQDILFHKEIFDLFKDTLLTKLQTFHKQYPLKSGLTKEELKALLKKEIAISEEIFSLIPLIDKLAVEKNLIRLKDFKVAGSQSIEDTKNKILHTLNDEYYQPSLKTELAKKLTISEKDLTDILTLLTKAGLLVRINDSMYITKEKYDDMISLLKKHFSKKQDMTVAEFRDLLKTTRKYALQLLEYLDSNKITLRVGEIRKLMLK
ncbi:MAG: selenocysteine-specific translation elongation factor [Thermodesulfovibrionales bacterium]|nr:selenocysteine-specific translation elongation factor [Thermodesulfovibrionales bacterium]